VNNYLSLIKFSHTIFAMPFALVGYFLGISQTGFNFDPKILILVILCMIFARSAAMAFNRYLDRDIDKSNPRTKTRELPAGIISIKNAKLFVILSSFCFVITSAMINNLCFILSPVALAVILGYSYTKRFTAYCHLVLGLGLSLAPIGAFIAVTSYFDFLPVLLGIGVFFWVAGFDIIYALQDEEFDKKNKLKSIPALFGKKWALIISRFLHLGSIMFMSIFFYQASIQFENLSIVFTVGTILFILMIVYQHLLVKPNDLSKVNLAFFTTNGVASLVYGLFFIIDMLT